MPIEVFTHTLPDNQRARFSLWERRSDNGSLYFAKVIVATADEEEHGAHVTDGNQNIVYYRDVLRLKADILAYYGTRRLISEI